LSFIEPDVPTGVTSWYPQSRWPGTWRDPVVCAFGNWAFQRRIGRHVNHHRRLLGLPARSNYLAHWSGSLARVSQCPDVFDFPRRVASSYHGVGSIRSPGDMSVPFPFERLDGRPLVYASLGSLQGGRRELFAAIAEACAPLDVQLVITHGHQLDERAASGFAGDPIVVPYAPQRELLGRARLAIFHAGMNTVLDALEAGVPMVVIPLAFEQPGIAARVGWHGAGEVVPLAAASAERIRSATRRVLSDPSYREAAQRIGAQLPEAGGLARAVRIIQQAFATRQPVPIHAATSRALASTERAVQATARSSETFDSAV
jgi:zeaxanthin glucosyltransferase